MFNDTSIEGIEVDVDDDPRYIQSLRVSHSEVKFMAIRGWPNTSPQTVIYKPVMRQIPAVVARTVSDTKSDLGLEVVSGRTRVLVWAWHNAERTFERASFAERVAMVQDTFDHNYLIPVSAIVAHVLMQSQ
jgi:hypothetical protein